MKKLTVPPVDVAMAVAFPMVDALRHWEHHAQGNLASGTALRPDVVKHFIDKIGINYIGYSITQNNFNLGRIYNAYVPLAISILKHKLYKMLGVTRDMSRVPYIGKVLKY